MELFGEFLSIIGLVLYTVLSFILLILVYKKTKILLDLSNHKGIFFFSYAFLFLAISNLFYLPIKQGIFSFTSIHTFKFILATFHSSLNLGILFLSYSQFYNYFSFNFSLNQEIFILSLISIILSFLGVFMLENFVVLFSLNLSLFLFLSIRSFVRYDLEEKKSKKSIKFMFFIFFLLSLISWSVDYFEKFFFIECFLFIFVTSIFHLIYYYLSLYVVSKVIRGIR